MAANLHAHPLWHACVTKFTSTPAIMYPSYLATNWTASNVTASHCNATFDGNTCWPPIRRGHNFTVACPASKGYDASKNVTRTCVAINDTIKGIANYNTCYSPEVREIMEKLSSGGEDARRKKIQIATSTRMLEIFGLTTSLIALVISLVIFLHFRNLKNNRTRIHVNLFTAMVIQVTVRLILYMDQLLAEMSFNDFTHVTSFSIESTPYVCEAFYAMLEYTRTAMFMWMFVEGFYLNSVLTMTIFQEYIHFLIYKFLGWAIPAILIVVWVSVMSMRYTTTCWFEYNLIGYYWILEGPRYIVMLLNLAFLLNIIRVLLLKLRQSNASEIVQVRKAVKAALFLLPLLGISNILFFPAIGILDKPVWEFAVWSYTTHFITSFQGFFIASIYCFSNGEVRATVMKSVTVYLSTKKRSVIVRKPPTTAFISNECYDATCSFVHNNPYLAKTRRKGDRHRLASILRGAPWRKALVQNVDSESVPDSLPMRRE